MFGSRKVEIEMLLVVVTGLGSDSQQHIACFEDMMQVDEYVAFAKAAAQTLKLDHHIGVHSIKLIHKKPFKFPWFSRKVK